MGNSARPNKKKVILIKFSIVLISYLILEAGCWLTIHFGFINAKEPTFDFVFKNPQYPAPVADINPVWGVWHYKEHYQSQNGCVYFNYFINSYGARDKERTKLTNDTNRVIVLGDSFMEGFGVNVEDRVSDILERRTGRAFLNFSCADFGTTQEYLVYKYLADSFSHSTIFIGFLPFNDFENDDLLLAKSDDERYRPYYVKKDSGYQLLYHQDSLGKSTFNKEHYKVYSNSLPNILTRFLRAYTYWFNIVDFIKNSKEQYRKRYTKDGRLLSYYYDFNAEQIDRLSFLLGKFRNLARNKRIIFCSIPVISDFKRHLTEKGIPPLSIKLKQICDSLKIEYVDLMSMFPQNRENRDFFLPCDQHWNKRGNIYCANILEPLFK
jgi:hypothetical protein